MRKARELPVAFGGGNRDARRFGGLFRGQAAEVSQFHEPRFSLVDPDEAPRRHPSSAKFRTFAAAWNPLT